MRVSSVMPIITANSFTGNEKIESSKQTMSKALSSPPLPGTIAYNDITFKRGFSVITFSGNSEKKLNQVLSLAFENRGTGLAEDYQGGMGVVTQEGPASLIEHEKLGVRNISPFHEYNNPKGGFKFLDTKRIKLKNGRLPEEIEDKYFLSGYPGQSLEDYAKMFNHDPKDLRYVIQSEPNGKSPNSKSKYCLIEPTSAKGEFERMSDIDIGKTTKIKYQVFKIAADNPKYNLLKDKPNYWMYTQELAKIPKPYTYGPDGCGGMNAEIINSDFCRAVLKAGEQMNTKEFGYFNPGNFWLHDRPVATFLSHMAEDSACGNNFYDGTISHFTMHNPRRAYQGITHNPFEFARVIFSKEQIKELSEHPHYNLLQNFNARGWDNLNEFEKNFVREILDPYIGNFKDYFGTYNLTKIAITAKKVNPKNSSLGTVSRAFDKQMKNPDMDVAPGLGQDLREVETVSPLNGSTPANLGLDNNTADFGRGNNTLSAKKRGFTPLVYNGSNIEEIIANREKNAIWLSDILREAEKEGPEAVNKVFYNDMQISQGRSIYGSISNLKKGDMLVVGWGRPDEQKGFPISLEGALKFFKRKDIPKELKQRVHYQFGWGDSPFDKYSREWKLIKKAFDEIQKLDGGAYKHNIQMCDGRYPNKLVACATHSMFTSRDEICGITPFESKTAGVPYLTTAAGGPKDYTNNSNGWLTKTAPEMNPEFDKLNWNTPADVIDEARIARSSDEVSDCLKAMVEEYVNNKPAYIARCKKNIEEKGDWHNNNEYNGGKSANKVYTQDIWHIDEGWSAREKRPLNRLTGKLKEGTAKVVEFVSDGTAQGIQKIRNKWTKTIIWTGVGIAALGTAAYIYIKRFSNKPEQTPEQLNKAA